MLFDIGCCCSIRTGGIYDFYARGGAASPVADERDNDYVIARFPSQSIIIYDYIYPNNTIFEGTYGGAQITSYYDGLYTKQWKSGPSPRILIQKQGPYSMNLVGEERIWNRNSISPYGDQTDYFNNSGIGGITGGSVTLGTGARLEEDRLILTTDNETSGCYIEWTFSPTDQFSADFIMLDIPKTFDKTLLIGITGGGTGIYNTNSWWKPSATPFANRFGQVVNTASSSFTGTFFGDEFQFIPAGETEDHLHLAVYIDSFSEPATINKLRLQLVDDRYDYTIDDVSGYSLRIRNLLMPYHIGTGYRYPNGNDPSDGLLELIDPINDNTIFTHVFDADADYQTDVLSLKDYYLYRSAYANWTGFRSDAAFFTWDNNTSLSLDSSTSNPIIVNDFDYTGSIIVQRLLKNNLSVLNQETTAFSSDGKIIASYNKIDVGQLTTNYNSLRNLGYFYYNGSVIPRISHWSARSIDTYMQTQSPLGSNYNASHFLFKSLDSDTNIVTTLPDSPHLLWLAEQDVPLSEKKNFYEKTLDNIATGTFPTWNSSDIDSWNSDVVLPAICSMDTRNYPNVFAVLTPKQHYVNTTGEFFGIKPTTLSQTCKIVYGPIQHDEFTIQTISGQHMGVGTVGRVDFTGLGGTRPYTSYSYQAVTSSGSRTSSGGRVYDFTFDLVYGDKDGEVFWEDTLEQLVPYQPVFNYGGELGGRGSNPSVYTGIFQSPNVPNVTAQVLRACSHKPTNKKAASFIHSRNNYITGSLNISGEAYIKVKIGDNIVYDQRLYYVPTTEFPVTGPYALHTTEADQVAGMTGNYAAFVWFEKLYQTPPKAHRFTPASGFGVATGWKMHVANQDGMDLWSVEQSGVDQWLFSRPYVVDSSDRFFYVNNFLMSYPNVVQDNGNYLIRTQTFLNETGGIRNPRSGFAYLGSYYSGAGISWGFSHNGQSLIPCGSQFFDNLNVLGSFNKRLPSTTGYHILSQGIEGFTIKNSNLWTEAPILEDWQASFPYTGTFDMITGIDPYFPSGSPAEEDYVHPHWLISRTGFDMSQYPGYQAVLTGVTYLPLGYIQYHDYEVLQPVAYYSHSGTTQSGWYG